MALENGLFGLAGGLILLSAGCAPRQAIEGPKGTARAALTNVTWFDVVGASASGNSLTKTGAAGWNAGAASNETLSGDGYVELTSAEATTDKVVGLSHADPAQNYATVDFGFDLTSAGGVKVIEDGSFVFTGGTSATASCSTRAPRPRPSLSSSAPCSTRRGRPSTTSSSTRRSGRTPWA